jgi:arylsulfatase A-like enzyme/Flp pilus assembly protein TadD
MQLKYPGFRKKSLKLVIFLVILGSAVAWLFFQPGLFIKDVPNILLISIDTCRADYLSCYGYGSRTTPNIDKLAKESILFSNAYSPVPMTLPAHGSMLTGTIPPFHGVHDNLDYQLGQQNETLAEILGRNDFSTGAVISAFVLDSQFGLNQGFDYYNDRFEKPIKTLNINERRGGEVNRFALEWLEEHKSERFFLFLHYYDPHLKYEPPEPFATKFYGNPYAGEIAYTDHCIGQVIKKLKDLGLYESTLIVVTGDHGEMLGEHGENSHMYFIYQSAIKVPLIFKLPGRHTARKIDESVGIIDIAPTVCSMLGIRIPDQVQGHDLTDFFSQKQIPDHERPIYCESMCATRYGGNSLLGMVEGRWKYIQTTRPELYDLVEDPGETNNLVTQQPHRARILQERLKLVLEESVGKGISGSKAVLDEEGRRRLASLGYLADTGVNEDYEFDQSKDDPKDLIGFHILNDKARTLIFLEKFKEAKAVCERMIKTRPEDFHTRNLLAEIANKQDDFAEAIKHFSEALRINPEDAKTLYNLGNVFDRLGNTAEAIHYYAETLRIDPGFAEAHNNLAGVLLNQGKLNEAINHYSEALRLNPTDAEIHNNLGFIMARQGRVAEAISYYTEALRINPGFAEAHNGLGVVLANQGRIPEAIGHFSEAVRINPYDVKAQNNLKNALSAQSRQ